MSLDANQPNESGPINVTEPSLGTKIVGKKFLYILFFAGIAAFFVFIHSFHKSPVGQKSAGDKLSQEAKGRVVPGINKPPTDLMNDSNTRGIGNDGFPPPEAISPPIDMSPNGPNAPLPPGYKQNQKATGHNMINDQGNRRGVPIGQIPQAGGMPGSERKSSMSFESETQMTSKTSHAGPGGIQPASGFVSPASLAHPQMSAGTPSGGGAGQGNPLLNSPLGSVGLSGGGGNGYDQTNNQNGKEAFMRKAEKESREAYLTAYPVSPRSRYEIEPGTMIPGVLLSRIDSDTPGQVYARVSANVYNDRAGHHNEVLVPANSRLEGHYSSNVSYGQTRVQVAWDRIVFPDNSTLEIHGMAGLDKKGSAGFHDQVDNHYVKIFGSALVLSFFTAAAQLSQPINGGSALSAPTESQVAAGAVGQEMSTVGAGIAQQNLNIQPTLKIREGYAFNIFVNKVMMFPRAYKVYKQD